MNRVHMLSTGIVLFTMASFHHATLAERPKNRFSHMNSRAAHKVPTASHPEIQLRLEVLEVSVSQVQKMGMSMAVGDQQDPAPDIVGRFSQEVLNGNDESKAAQSLRDAVDEVQQAGWGKLLFDQSTVVPLGQAVATRIPQAPESSPGFEMLARSKLAESSATDGVSLDADLGNAGFAVELVADQIQAGRIHVHLKVSDQSPPDNPGAGRNLSTPSGVETGTRNAYRLIPDGGILAMSGLSRIERYESRIEKPMKLGRLTLPFASRVSSEACEDRIETIFIVTASLSKAGESTTR